MIGDNNHEKGFTLLELILVLAVVAIVSAVIIPVGEKWIRTTAEEDAIQSLVVTIHSLQSYAIANEAYTRLSFRKPDSRTMYVAAAPGKEEFSRKYLPEGMHVASYSFLKEIEFHPSGDIFNFGTLKLVTNTGEVTITFQFQRGRMMISESKRIFMARSDSDTIHYSYRLWYTAPSRYENDIHASQQENSNVRC